MDVVVPSICLSSVAGAILFYVGGRLHLRPPPALPRAPDAEEERAARRIAEEEAAGALRATRDAVAALAEERSRSTALREALAAERDGRAHADAAASSERRRLVEEAARPRVEASAGERRAAELLAELEKARAEIGRARVDATQARAETERATAAARRLSAEGAALRARAAEQLESARARVAEVEAKATDAKALATAAETKAARADARAAAAATKAAEAEARAAGADGLREDNRRLERAVATLEQQRAAAPDLGEVQRRSLSATMALRTVELRSEEIARREAENAELRRRVEALEGAAAEADALRLRVRELEARGFALGGDARAGARDDDDAPASEGLETSLVIGLREICQGEQGCRAAVLSDMRGLLIAAHGDAGHRLELAAAAALTTTTADRLRELLPLGEPSTFVLADANAMVFRTRWLRWDDDCFLLSTLGAAPAANAVADALRARLAALLGRG